jgi:hypothetical protein
MVSFAGMAQKQIIVDFGTTVDTVKDLLGGNKYFENTAELLHDEGIKTIRTHDYHGIMDYSDYSDFWDFDGQGNYTINQAFDPYDPIYYHWWAPDSVVNVIKTNGFDVFFRIGVSYPNPGIPPLPPYAPPCNSSGEQLDFSRFASLAKQTLRHNNEGWDNGHFFDINYWEVWNEPGGLFWDGSVLQFFKMYEAVCDSMKSYEPTIKIGAPGAVVTTTIGNNPEFRESFIDYCAQHELPLDFYSWHIYGAKNPYGIKSFADTIRNILDLKGYQQTESIISEINASLDSSLDTLSNSPYGAAYFLSTILTAQEGPIDMLMWYPSCVSVLSPNSGDTISSRPYYAMSCFHRLQDETPFVVMDNGNEVVEGNWDSFEDNFMVLSAKSEDEKKLYILVSNLQSDISALHIILQNLPWTDQDDLRITKSIINGQYVFHTEETYIQGASSIVIDNQNCPSPNVLFYQIEKVESTGLVELNVQELELFPNPATNKFNITNVKDYDVEVIDITGKTVAGFSKIAGDNVMVNLSNEAKGVYLIKCLNKNNNHYKIGKVIIR